MQPIEFNEMTNRLRRNLMGAAFLIIGIAGFDIKVGRASASGMELENLTTEVSLMVLLAFLIYHAFAFGIRAFEEYRHWELRLADQTKAWQSSDSTVVELADQMRASDQVIEKIFENQDISTNETRKFTEMLHSVNIYANRFQNFPRITRFRFWFWDIATAGGVSVIAILFAIAWLPAGLIGRWLL